uniref:Uncharacterized protein n=1 Tax=Arundo donax TaxID=35708 RepID=A0A0A9CNR1_ARUDO
MSRGKHLLSIKYKGCKPTAKTALKLPKQYPKEFRLAPTPKTTYIWFLSFPKFPYFPRNMQAQFSHI